MIETVEEFRKELLRWSRYSNQPKNVRKALSLVSTQLVDKLENWNSTVKNVSFEIFYHKEWPDSRAKITISPKMKQVRLYINNKNNRNLHLFKEIALAAEKYWLIQQKGAVTVRSNIDIEKYDHCSFRSENRIESSGRKTQFSINLKTMGVVEGSK